MKPIISVIIPVYNTEKYLRECLDSVCTQTLEDIEIICVNDRSSDNSLQILREYESRDARITVIDSETNRGVSASRNAGIEASSCEYLFFFDSDDCIDPDYLKRLYDTMTETDAEMVMNTNVLKESEDRSEVFAGNNVFYAGQSGRTYSRNEAFELGFNEIWRALYRKSRMDEYNIRFAPVGTHEDTYFQNLYMNRVEKVYVFYGACYHYRQCAMSNTHSNRDFLGEKLKMFDLLYKLYSEQGWLDRKIHFMPFRYIMQSYSEKDYPKLCAFAEKYAERIFGGELASDECDRYIVSALTEGLSYPEFARKYAPNILERYFMTALRNKIKKDLQNG